jgi:hypothetical protein
MARPAATYRAARRNAARFARDKIGGPNIITRAMMFSLKDRKWPFAGRGSISPTPPYVPAPKAVVSPKFNPIGNHEQRLVVGDTMDNHAHTAEA